MGRGFACLVLAAVLTFSAVSAMFFVSAVPPSGPIKIWEGYARGWVTVTQIDLTYEREGITVTFPVGYRVSVSASSPASVEVDEPAMLMSPSPAQFAVDPDDPTTQDGALTTGTIPAGSSVVYSYADEWLQGFLPAPPWWCTERFQVTRADVGIVLGGEILPTALQDIVANPYHDSDTHNSQEDLWNYLKEHPTVVVGKTPLWKEIPGTAGQVISVTVAATNIAVKDDNDAITVDPDANGAIVSDMIPSGWSVVAGSYSVTPTSVTDNPDGSKTVTWAVDLPAADVTGRDSGAELSKPTPYHGIKVRYQLETPRLSAGRIELPRAEVDTNADETMDAHSAIPLVDVFSVNQAPVAALGGPYLGVEGSPIRFDASASSDPDGDVLRFRWDFDSDGTWDTRWGPSPLSPPLLFGDGRSETVTIEVSDGELSSLANAPYEIANAPPTIDSITIAGADEGSPAEITVTYSDPGWLDTHSAFVDWGGGVMETITLTSTHDPPAARGTFTLSRMYGDDFDYAAFLALVDDDGGSVTQDLSVPVANVAPTVASADVEVFTEAQVCLRVAGNLGNTVRLDFFVDDVLVGSVSVTRARGSPNEQAQCIVVEVDLLEARSYRAEVVYEPKPEAKKGSNPVWLLIEPRRDPLTPGHSCMHLHHVFHVGDPATYAWTVPLPGFAADLLQKCGCDEDDDDDDDGSDDGDDDEDDDEDDGDDGGDDDDEDDDSVDQTDVANPGAPGLNGQFGSILGSAAPCGDDDDEDDEDEEDDEDDDDESEDDDCTFVIHFRVTARDVGTDDLTVVWDFGDGTTLTHTFFNDGASPDPKPSPAGVLPFEATDSGVHSLSRPFGKTITVTVTDDDGGVTVRTLSIRP